MFGQFGGLLRTTRIQLNRQKMKLERERKLSFNVKITVNTSYLATKRPYLQQKRNNVMIFRCFSLSARYSCNCLSPDYLLLKKTTIFPLNLAAYTFHVNLVIILKLSIGEIHAGSFWGIVETFTGTYCFWLM